MRRLLLLCAAPFVVLTGCSQGNGNRVTMDGSRRFAPTTITVAVGDTVTWTNDDSEAHTVTAYQDDIPRGSEYFASGDFSTERDARDDVQAGLLKEGESYRFTFERSGTYQYFCIPHEEQGMKGTVIVEEP